MKEKTNYLLAILLFVGISCKSQIVPLEEYINYRTNETEIPEGTYIKDINNLLNKFEGTWIGEYNNLSYEIIITQETVSFLNIQKDRLLMRFRITTLSGEVIEDTTGLSNDSYSLIRGDYLNQYGTTYILNYYGSDTYCFQDGNIFINSLGLNNNQMTLFLYPGLDSFNQLCESSNNPPVQLFPMEKMTLLKQ
ncbi:DUF6705 family protein [Dokdonia sp. PRO95]|uniref:DUF6705 family protein n=1 Tax=Dokdonia sp. PRO95 TaxID=1239415 RepID=UPI00068E8A55|nr:DUF6705 family protein [Dokdonia sp. PRO95]